jgi:4-amino-4-deoxy-L-arabinose transferase-like glycosyltransferase
VTATVAPPGQQQPDVAAAPDAPRRIGVRARGRAASSSPRRRRILLVVAALAVGFALRVAIATTDDAPATDETAYLRSGISLVEGHGFARNGRPELHFPPFVPFLLGVSAEVFDDPHTGTVVLTCLASTALILPLTLLSRRLAGPTAAVATAWVAALAPGLSTTLTNRGAGSEAEYTLLAVSAVWLVVSGLDRGGTARLLRLAGAGLLVGLAYLTRPEGLFFAVPLGLAILFFCARRRPSPPAAVDGNGADTGAGAAEGAGDRRWRPLAAIVPAVAFCVPILVCVVPYAGYLHAHTGSWQLSAKTQDVSIDAWRAVARSHREARDEILWGLDATGLHFPTERRSLVSLARQDTHGYVGIVGTNVEMLGEQLFMPENGHPVEWLLLPLPVWLVAFLGAWRWRRSWLARLILAVCAVPVATTLVFFVQPRYLVVLVALATVFVGAGLATMSQRWRRPVLAVLLVALALSTIQGFHGSAGGWWHPTDGSDQRAAGEWIAAHTDPDDRVMTRSMVVEYYAQRQSMAMPYADLPQIIAYARYYGAQYLVADWYTADRLRPQLRVLRDPAARDGLRLVHELREEGRITRIFALDPTPPHDRPAAPPLGFVGDG